MATAPKPSCKTTATVATSTTTTATTITTTRVTTRTKRCKVRVKVHRKWRTKIKTTVTRSYQTTTQPVAQPVPTPVPTPSPEPPSKPAPKPIESLSLTVAVWEPINTANPEYEVPKAGEHFVAVELGLTNIGATTITGNANLDTSVIGTNGQNYTTNFDERKGCTDFSSGDFTLSPGAHEIGCVVFELPLGVTVAKVQFGLNWPEVETTRTF